MVHGPRFRFCQSLSLRSVWISGYILDEGSGLLAAQIHVEPAAYTGMYMYVASYTLYKVKTDSSCMGICQNHVSLGFACPCTGLSSYFKEFIIRCLQLLESFGDV